MPRGNKDSATLPYFPKKLDMEAFDAVCVKAAETFSFNDFASNGGILVAGALVLWLGQAWPDLVVGVLVAAIALKGGVDILRDAAKDRPDEGEAQ